MLVNDNTHVGDLGVVEYWVMDDEGGVDPLIKSKCQPFMLAPGYRVEVPGPYASPKERIPKRPGFPTDVTGLGRGNVRESMAPGRSGGVFGLASDGTVLKSNMPQPTTNIFGFNGLGSLGYFEIVSPAGGQIAAFRCRPYYVESDLAVIQATGANQILRQRGAAEFPEGTVRPREQNLRTVRR